MTSTVRPISVFRSEMVLLLLRPKKRRSPTLLVSGRPLPHRPSRLGQESDCPSSSQSPIGASGSILSGSRLRCLWRKRNGECWCGISFATTDRISCVHLNEDDQRLSPVELIAPSWIVHR